MVNTGLPLLRFSEFSEEWERKNLEEITSWSSGGTPSKENSTYWNGSIPWISASSMRGLVYFDSDRKLTEAGLNNGSRLALKDSILLLVRGSMLFNKIPVGITGRDVAFNQDVKAIIIKEGHLTKYVLYWLIASENKLLDMVVGTGIGAGKLELSDLKKLKIPLPSLPEQQKIVSFLTAIDAKIELLTKKKALLELYKKGFMQQLFSQQIRFKDDEGNDFTEWEEKTLGDIGHKFLNGGTPSTSNIEFWDGSIPWITGADFLNQEIGSIRRFITQKAIANSSTNVVPKGWLLLVTRTGVGKMAIAPYDVAISQDITGIQLKEEVLTEYLFNYLSFKQQDLINQNQGTSINGIKRNDLLNIKILVPCIGEQKKIADFINSVDKKNSALGKEIELTKIFKKGLLQQLFI